MTNNDLIYLADLNLAESMREIARWKVDSEIIEQGDLLLVVGGDATPLTNSAIRMGNQALPPAEEVMDKIRNYFWNRNLGYSIHIRRHLDSDLEDRCRSEKMTQISESPGMAIQEPIQVKNFPAGVTIKTIENHSGAIDFSSVVIDSYQRLGMPKETAELMFETPERMLRPYNHLVVAYWNDKPVSGAMIIFSHSIAGIYWVGTIESARNQGLAEACTSLVTNEAFRRGACLVVLQASQFGEPIYRRLGFQEFTRYPWYMHFHKA
jgi:ribosomal protein S18 acetylase RimI-like enzyme